MNKSHYNFHVITESSISIGFNFKKRCGFSVSNHYLNGFDKGEEKSQDVTCKVEVLKSNTHNEARKEDFHANVGVPSVIEAECFFGNKKMSQTKIQGEEK